ncbi:alpha/beta fold hydrolase [Subtercola lobariae]|uniref:Hydrolase n=1 Tax=Subtercola lobariae TaxID=1588641 RepID=A0A917BH68_9MICO|nr:alpha/beta hydrolase [Subtercola lobariae]GGF41627.1 hydrolase [Subtercola lobariae]
MQTLDLIGAEDGIEFGYGVRLDARLEGSSGPLALVLPGSERSSEDAVFIEALAAHFTVVAPSHPGFGLSPRPEWCASVSDIADIYLDWLEASGHTDVILIGLQFGGWVALEMATRSRSRIAQLVLVDSFGVKLGSPTDRNFADVFATPHDQLENLIYADQAFALGELGGAPENTVLEMARNDEALAIYGWEPYLYNRRLGQTIDRIAVPTLVVWGAEDGIASPDYGRRLAAHLPHARFEQIEQAGHRPQVERPHRVAELILTAAR